MKSVIAISGMPGSGSTTAAKLLAQKLGVEYLSPGRIFKDIGRGIIRKQSYFPLFENICADKNLLIPDFAESNDSHAVERLWATDFGKDPLFHEAIDDLQKQFALEKDCIIDGKLSIHMLPSAYKIWFKASVEHRIPRIAQRDNISLEEVKQSIGPREKKERDEWKRLYGFDYFDQDKEADLIIDTADKHPEEIVALILQRIAV